jgi:hypothetical protein
MGRKVCSPLARAMRSSHLTTSPNSLREIKMNQVTNGAFRTLLFLLLFLLLPTCVLKADETKKKQLADQSKKIVKLKSADSNSAKGSKKLARGRMSTRARVQKTLEYAKKNEQKRKRKITGKIVRMYQQRNDANRKLRLLKRRQKSEALKTKVLKKKQPKKTEIRLAQFAEQNGDTKEKAKKKTDK